MEACNLWLANELGADKCHNINRVMRLAGTVNLKTGERAEVLRDNPDRVYTIDDFGAAEVTPPSEPPGASPVGEVLTPVCVSDPSEIDHWVTDERRADRLKMIMVHGRHPDEPKEGDDSRSAWVYDFTCNALRAGVPEDVVLGVLTDPQWDISEHVRAQSGRALKYASRQIERARDATVNDIGPGSPSDAFKVSPPPSEQLETLSLAPVPNGLPPRPWLVPGLLMDGQVTMLTGRGGDGKSLLGLHLATAVASGQPFAWWTPKQRRRVLLLNAEDDLDEQRRRLLAVCSSTDLDHRLLDGWLLTVRRDDLTLVARGEEASPTTTPLYAQLRQAVNKLDIGLVIVDPLVEAHVGLDENSNADMKALLVALRRLARDGSIPLLIIHHSRKGSGASDQDGARGASALVNACRSVVSMERMTEVEQDRLRPSLPRERYIRVANGKLNYLGRATDRWLRIDAVGLDCGDDAPALVRQEFTGLDGLDQELREEVWRRALELVEHGRPNGAPWSWATTGPSSSRLTNALADEFDALTAHQAAEMLQALVDEGRLHRGETSHNKNKIKAWRLGRPPEQGKLLE